MVFTKRIIISKRLLLLVILACFVFVISLAVLNPVYYSENLSKDDIVNFEADKIPGGYAKYVHHIPANESYCHFNYGLPDVFHYKETDLKFSPELGSVSPYRIIYNVLQARMTEDVPAVTYATHVSANFVNYISELVRFWEGPLSVAAYVPNEDAVLVLEQVIHFCYCIPEMSRVSLHFVFPKDVTTLPKAANLVPTFLKPSDCVLVDSTTLNSYQSSTRESVYPVNVCRNVARSSALTKYVMVSDAELMPSKGLASRFLTMIESSKADSDVQSSNTVYVVPIFEVESTESIPRSKRQLLDLIKQEKAVYFHRMTCVHCQKFPKIEEWLLTDPGDVVKPLTVTKREVPYNRWEPIYIGTKDEPFYSERLSWEGLQDKMLQMLEMCLMSYDFVILDGAFLCHWPGIKKVKQKNDEKWRVPFVKANARQYDDLLNKISQKYLPNPKCKLK